MALRLVASAAVVGVAAGTINLSISDCGDSSTHGKVASISPTSVSQGTKTLVTGTGTLDTTVADGDYNVNVKALGVSMKKCKADLCGSSACALPAFTGHVDFRGLSCPQSAGTVSLGFDVTVSKTVPSSLAVLDIEITSQGSAGKLLCANIHTSPGLGFAQRPSWEEYKEQYAKVYNGVDEDSVRQAVFETAVQAIEEQNMKGESLKFGYNRFTDMTNEEFKALPIRGLIPEEQTEMPILGEHVYNGEELADSVNWVTAGAVNPVKDQAQCGSCWAFGTTGGIEGAWQIGTGSLKSLSEQQLVDCSTQNLGCQGGNAGYAINFEKTVNVASEASYPYKGVQGTCKTSGFTTAIPQGGVTGFSRVGNLFFGGSVTSMKSALQQQPVSIAIEADQDAFQKYESGVLSSGCGTSLDHAVLAVGYGTEDGQDYWLVKNSWGTSWGADGYIKIGSATDVCGVLKQAVYPSVSGSVAV